MLLKDRVAVVYGAGGHVGSTVATTLAREGAVVFLAGRTLEKLAPVAEAIAAAGGRAEFHEVDALDKGAIEGHLNAVVAAAGGLDITFNAVWIRGDLQGTALVDMQLDDFTTPVTTGISTHFLTATAAARHMVRRGSGVILTLSSSAAGLSGRDESYHSTGGFGVACAAIEHLSRVLAAQLGPKGIRVVCLRSDALPETWPDQFAGQPDSPLTYMTAGTVLKRMPRLAELAEAAAFAASDRASAMTGTIFNLTCGSVLDKD
jgi:NAD(P)-dependent dehydrogenase (short-subunit alcohol dehydrogenase family)